MTRLPFKVRFWKRKLDDERPAFSVSRTLARRVFYAGAFFYASFLVHGHFVYDKTALAAAAEPESVAAIATAEAPLERGVLQPVLDGLLGREGRPR